MAGLKRRAAHDEGLHKVDHTRLLQARSYEEPVTRAAIAVRADRSWFSVQVLHKRLTRCMEAGSWVLGLARTTELGSCAQENGELIREINELRRELHAARRAVVLASSGARRPHGRVQEEPPANADRAIRAPVDDEVVTFDAAGYDEEDELMVRHVHHAEASSNAEHEERGKHAFAQSTSPG